ncbi:MAG: alginate export family protein [Dokdonella sp.]
MSTRHSIDARCALGFAIALALLQGAPAISAAEPGMQSGPVVELRYRYEGVSDDAFARDANANTLRLRLGYRWLFAPGWQLYADGEHVQSLFGAHYNSTANGKTRYPVVADPQSDEINQAYIAYANDHVGATLGRQRVMLDNQRFFGNVGWRQNEQTFDAVALRYAFGDGGPTVRYTYLDRVLRVNGHDNPNPLLREWSLDGHLLNVMQVVPLGVLTGYGYLVENHDIATLSTRTFGARWTGAQMFADIKLSWTVEYARQSDWANNPAQQDASYRLFEPSVEWHGIGFKAGWEVLGGNGRYGFSTPYATLHVFNGWADRFSNTPHDGLDDRYVGATGKIGGATWTTTWHDFHADHGGSHYGSEWDASVSYPLRTDLTGLVKIADYRSDGFSTDEQKFWFSLEYRY